MIDRWPAFLAAVAEADQPRAAFVALEAITKETVGTLLFTAMTHDTVAKRSLRIYSGNEQAYPTGGWKPLNPGPWPTRVIDQRQTFVANTIEEIAVVFPDYPLIQSLGCESALNLPAVVGDKVIGTLNLLHAKEYYTPERVALAQDLLPYATIAFLIANETAART